MVGKLTTLAELGDWTEHFVAFKQQPSYLQLAQFLQKEIRTKQVVLPLKNDWFKAFKLCTFKKTKVVILGQDPYPNPHHAHGLCFSVPPNTKPLPASLDNIFKAIEYDLNLVPQNGNLEHWANQGVLLLNAVLTVRQKQIGSHQNQGWEVFTDYIIHSISTQKQGVVFLLWGKAAQQKKSLIDSDKHLILTTSHPSPLSAHHGFLSCKHFSKTNTYLAQQNQAEINWQ